MFKGNVRLDNTFAITVESDRRPGIQGKHPPTTMPGSEYDHSRVRLRFLENLFWKCVLPSAVLAALRVTQIDFGYLTVPSHIAFISTLFYLKTLYNDYHVSREAHRRGARQIPRVVGKWPGNVDVMLRLFADLKSGYMQDVFLELFHEYQSTTLNLSILWTDKVRIMFGAWITNVDEAYPDYHHGFGTY